MSNRLIVSLIAICILSLSVVVRAERRMVSRDALVGKWSATVTPEDNSGHAFTDTLEIKGGKFSSEALAKDGYDAAPYEDKPSPLGAAAQFSVTLTNKAGDTAKWTGTSAGKDMTGELTITKKGGVAVSYTFAASRP